MLIIEKKNKELASFLANMTELVQESVATATDAVATENFVNSADTIDKVLKNDKHVDELEHILDHKALELLVLINPYASDFRFVFSVTKIAKDLERIADECKNVVKTFPNLETPLPEEIKKMATEVKEIYEGCAKDLVEHNVANAKSRIKKDAEVDAMELLVLSKFPNNVPYAFLVKALERIGDHCTNIIEEFVYAYEGVDLSDARTEAKISEK